MPSEPHSAKPDRGAITLRLSYLVPLDLQGLLAFLARRAVPGIEQFSGGIYRRSLGLPHGAAVVELAPGPGHVVARYVLDDVRDLAPAVQRTRTLLDLDSDPVAVLDALGPDPVIGPMIRKVPGRRVPGHVAAHELAMRAVLGQQVSLTAAATLAARLVAECGRRLRQPIGSVTHVFPHARAVAEIDPRRLAMPESRRRALIGLAAALADGRVVLDPAAERLQARRQLTGLPGIGDWTAEYVAMRALRDPDAFLASDLGVRHALERLGLDGRPSAARALAERWRPYRAYAVQHLWASLASAAPRAAGRVAASAP